MPGENWEDYETMEQIEGASAGISKDWTDQWQANARKEGRRECRRTGRREGRSRAAAMQRSTLEQQVHGKFGEVVAAAFANAIAKVESPKKLIDLAVHIGTSESGDELLESVRNV